MVWLHHNSRLFPDVYYDRYQKHFTLVHYSGAHYNVRHPHKYVGVLVHNSYEAGKTASPRAKLLPAYFDNPQTMFLVDSCVWEYRDRTTDFEDKPTPLEHFVWLSYDLMPFCTDPGNCTSCLTLLWVW